MSQRYSVLLLEGPGGRLGDLAGRLGLLRIQALRAASSDDAARLLPGPRHAPCRVACLAAALAHEPLEPWLRVLARVTPALPVLVVGPRPGAEVRRRLRQAGLRLALWEPYDDGALRFQLNRALHDDGSDPDPRQEQRIPTPLIARVLVGDRMREALVYNLSVSGAFLETPRAALRGAEIELELPLPEEHVKLAAHVVYANVPGNLERPNLPYGMGVVFDAPSRAAIEAIRRYVEQRSVGLAL
jgi:hypothetical protein